MEPVYAVGRQTASLKFLGVGSSMCQNIVQIQIKTVIKFSLAGSPPLSMRVSCSPVAILHNSNLKGFPFSI